MQNVRNSLCRKQWTIFMRNNEKFYLMQKKKFMNAVNKFEYKVNMMCREQILLM